MYDLFIGNYGRILGMTVYHKIKNEFIPCVVTNYYFKIRKYALVPLEDMESIPTTEHTKRRLFYTTKVYVKVK